MIDTATNDTEDIIACEKKYYVCVRACVLFCVLRFKMSKHERKNSTLNSKLCFRFT